jgi:hypothetical protein
MSSREAPKPLTEEQRNQVRSLLKQLGEASLRRSKRKLSLSRSRSTTRTPKRSRNLSLKYMKPKKVESPFDGIDEGQTVEGVDLPPICNTMPVVQRVRLMLIPLHYDDVEFDRQMIIDMVKDDLGADLSVDDGGTKDTLRFIVDSNPPIRNVYIYLQPGNKDPEKYMLLNWMYST